ncbi:MAG: DegV family protein [Clostridiales bacterium]|nr:DegV family protein [Clostridiales bacterium]
MNDFILSCDSTIDLTLEHVRARGLEFISYHFFLDGVMYKDDLGQTIPHDQFYEKLKKGADAKTSQINIEEYLEYFTPYLEQGKDILHVSLSSGLSGSYNHAVTAAKELSEKYPDRKIYIVDSLGASSGVGLIMDTLADLRDEGKNIDELYGWVEENKLRMNYWFFSTDLSFYVKGGRITKTEGMLGGLLGICPLMNVNSQGKLVPREKVRTKKRVIRELVARMEEYADGGLDYSGKCYVVHSACYEDAREIADLIEARFPKINGRVLINSIGTTIGSHSGPGTAAVFFWGKKRED